MEPLALLEHQTRSVEWARMRESNPHKGVVGGVVYAKMGLGKTVIGMVICEGKLNLLVCPKGLLNVWREHNAKWFPERKVIYFHKDVMGASRYNNMTYEEMTSADMVVTTYDVVQGVDRKHKFGESESVSVYGDGMMTGKVVEVKCRRSLLENKSARGEDLLYAIKWRRLMLDEGHKISNHATKVYKAMMAVYAERRWVLTGTLIRNKDTDLWSVLRFIGYTGCPSARNWDEDVFFREKLNTVILEMDYEDANIQLPARHDHPVPYQFSVKEQSAYDVVKKRVVSAYNDMMLGNTNYMYVLALFTRLRQMCVAPFLITPEAKRSYRSSDSPVDEEARRELDEITGNLESWIHDSNGTAGIHSSKMNAIKDIVRLIPVGEKVIIFSCWTSALDLIEDSFIDAFSAFRAGEPRQPASEKVEKKPIVSEVAEMLRLDGDFDDLSLEERDRMIAEVAEKAGRRESECAVKPFSVVMLDGDSSIHQRKHAVDTFNNDPDCRVLLANSRTAGEGLTMIVANHVIQCEPWWSSAVHEQNFSRVHRFPQKKECHLYTPFATSSIETEMVMEICRKKDEMKARYFPGKKEEEEVMPGSGKPPGMGKALLGQMLGVY